MGSFIYPDSDCNREIYNWAFQIGDWELGIGYLGLGNRLTGIGCNRLELAEMGGNRPIPAFCSLFLYIPAFSHIFKSIPTYFSLFHNIPVHSNLFRFFPAYSGVFKHMLSYSGLFWFRSLFLPIPNLQSPNSNL